MGFAASVADGITIGCSSLLSISSGRTNNIQHFFLTSILVFQSAAVTGRRISNSTPAASPVRWWQYADTSQQKVTFVVLQAYYFDKF